MKNDTSINTPTKVGQSEIISLSPTPSPDRDAQKNLRELGGENLGEYIECQFRNVCTTLRHLQPLIEEMKRKFDLLPRGKRTDGTYSTIRGCRSFKEWVETKLKRTARAVYYLLAGGNPQTQKAKPASEEAKKARGAQQPGAYDPENPSAEGAVEEVGTKDTKQALACHPKIAQEIAISTNIADRFAEAYGRLNNVREQFEELRHEADEDTNEGQAPTQGALECKEALEEVLRNLDGAISAANRVSFPGSNAVA